MADGRRALRMLALMLFTLLAWLQYRLWFGEGGAVATSSLQSNVERQAMENHGLQQRNELLVAEVENLKSGESAVEERARSELGMIKPGETFYRVVEAQAPVETAEDQPLDEATDPQELP
jgi:cell division protein FtsB